MFGEQPGGGAVALVCVFRGQEWDQDGIEPGKAVALHGEEDDERILTRSRPLSSVIRRHPTASSPVTSSKGGTECREPA